ncbi:MAG: helix-turn-helix transcriptional regulator [Bacteroidota bacterium]
MKLPSHLDKINKEFIGIDGELYRIKMELVHFTDFEASTLYKLQSLLDDDLIAQVSLDKLEITDPDSKLQKFAICRFGGFDDKPDITDTEETNEYYDCGKRGSCPVEGKLCKHVDAENGYLTPREIHVIKLIAEDLPDKQIADRLNISINTVNTHRRRIAAKIGCDTKVGICRFAIEKRIV